MTSRTLFSQLLAVFILSVLSTASLSGCISEPPPPPPPEPVAEEPSGPEPVEHVVRYSGETLGLISKWYTGDAANWNLIVDANPGLKPNRLNLGKVINIPGELVQKRDALPKSVIPRVSAPVQKTAEKQPEPASSQSAAAAEGDQPAMEQPEAKAPAADPTVDQLLEELATNAQNDGAKAAPPPPPPPAPPVEAAPDPGPSAPSGAPGAGDAEREQLLDELLEQ